MCAWLFAQLLVPVVLAVGLRTPLLLPHSCGGPQSLDSQLNAERRVFVKEGRESGRGVQEIDIAFLLDCTYDEFLLLVCFHPPVSAARPGVCCACVCFSTTQWLHGHLHCRGEVIHHVHRFHCGGEGLTQASCQGACAPAHTRICLCFGSVSSAWSYA
jgi:hypothetical protein